MVRPVRWRVNIGFLDDSAPWNTLNSNTLVGSFQDFCAAASSSTNPAQKSSAFHQTCWYCRESLALCTESCSMYRIFFWHQTIEVNCEAMTKTPVSNAVGSECVLRRRCANISSNATWRATLTHLKAADAQAVEACHLFRRFWNAAWRKVCGVPRLVGILALSHRRVHFVPPYAPFYRSPSHAAFEKDCGGNFDPKFLNKWESDSEWNSRWEGIR